MDCVAFAAPGVRLLILIALVGFNSFAESREVEGKKSRMIFSPLSLLSREY